MKHDNENVRRTQVISAWNGLNLHFSNNFQTLFLTSGVRYSGWFLICLPDDCYNLHSATSLQLKRISIYRHSQVPKTLTAPFLYKEQV